MCVNSLFNQICLINLILLVWFKTNAFVEYVNLFKLNKLFRVDKFLEYKKINIEIDYVTFLMIKNPNFITKLVSCTYCFNFWLSLSSCFLFKNIIYLPIIYMASILSFLILEKFVYGRK